MLAKTRVRPVTTCRLGRDNLLKVQLSSAFFPHSTETSASSFPLLSTTLTVGPNTFNPLNLCAHVLRKDIRLVASSGWIFGKIGAEGWASIVLSGSIPFAPSGFPCRTLIGPYAGKLRALPVFRIIRPSFALIALNFTATYHQAISGIANQSSINPFLRSNASSSGLFRLKRQSWGSGKRVSVL